MSYYIYYNQVKYYLDATASMSVTDTAKLTSHPTADKKTRSDNYVKENPTATYSGYLTDIRTLKSLKQMSAGDYIDALRSAMDSKSSVVFRYRLDKSEETGWFITSIRTTQTKDYGVGFIGSDGKVVQAFQIDISLEKALYTEVLETEFNVPQSFKDGLQPQTTSSGLPKYKDDTVDENLTGSLKSVVEYAEAQQNAKFAYGQGQYGILKAQLRELENQNN